MDVNVKEAIEFLKGIKHSGNGYGNSYISDFDKLKDIIALLQQGEQYRQLVGELEYCLLPEQWEVVEILMKKYFPKEAKQDYPENDE